MLTLSFHRAARVSQMVIGINDIKKMAFLLPDYSSYLGFFQLLLTGKFYNYSFISESLPLSEVFLSNVEEKKDFFL